MTGATLTVLVFPNVRRAFFSALSHPLRTLRIIRKGLWRLFLREEFKAVPALAVGVYVWSAVPFMLWAYFGASYDSAKTWGVILGVLSAVALFIVLEAMRMWAIRKFGRERDGAE